MSDSKSGSQHLAVGGGSGSSDRQQRAIAGSLEDVVVSDVMQFIQLGKRTGTLVLRRHEHTAMLGFHRGRLIAAAAPHTPKLRHMLVSNGLIDRKHQDEPWLPGGDRVTPQQLGQLVASGAIEEEPLRELVAKQLEQAMAEILRWPTGTFEFDVDNLSPIDDVMLLPDDAQPDTRGDAQSVIIEATRIFDERSRRTAPEDTEEATSEEVVEEEEGAGEIGLSAAEISEAVEPLSSEEPQPAAELLELQVVTEDAPFVDDLRWELASELARVRQVGVGRAGETALGAPAPIVLVDLRQDPDSTKALGAIRNGHPQASVVALVSPGGDVGRAYAAGALSVVPPEATAVGACVASIIENRRDLVRGRRSQPADPGVARLRRMMDDLRSGVMSASMALNLMHVISESVERAVLFLVKQDELAVLGAFGHDSNGRLLASSTRGLRLPLAQKNALTTSIIDGSVVSGAFEDAALPDPLLSLLGRPASGQAVVFPVQGAQRVISVVYADNGERPEPVEDIEILELATAQVGIAFENELLRRELASKRS